MTADGSDLADDLACENLLAHRHDGVDWLVGRTKAAMINAHDPPASQISGVDDAARAGREDPRTCGGSQINATVAGVPVGGTGGERSRDSKGAIEGRSPSRCLSRDRHEEAEKGDDGHENESGSAHLGRLPGRGSRNKVFDPPCG